MGQHTCWGSFRITQTSFRVLLCHSPVSLGKSTSKPRFSHVWSGINHPSFTWGSSEVKHEYTWCPALHIVFVYLFILERDGVGGAERRNLSSEPNVGLDTMTLEITTRVKTKGWMPNQVSHTGTRRKRLLRRLHTHTTLRSWPEPKSRAGCLTDWTTQALLALFYFWKLLRAGSQLRWEEDRDFPYTSCPYTYITCPLTTSVIRVVYLLPRMNLHWHIFNHPKSMVNLRVSHLVHTVGLDKCVMTYLHHYNIIQSIFTGLKIYTAFLNCWMLLHCIVTYHTLFIHSSVDRQLGCFHLGAIMNNAGRNKYKCKSLYRHSFLLCWYVGMELLSHMETLCLTSWKIFQKQFVPPF